MGHWYLVGTLKNFVLRSCQCPIPHACRSTEARNEGCKLIRSLGEKMIRSDDWLLVKSNSRHRAHDWSQEFIEISVMLRSVAFDRHFNTSWSSTTPGFAIVHTLWGSRACQRNSQCSPRIDPKMIRCVPGTTSAQDFCELLIPMFSGCLQGGIGEALHGSSFWQVSLLSENLQLCKGYTGFYIHKNPYAGSVTASEAPHHSSSFQPMQIALSIFGGLFPGFLESFQPIIFILHKPELSSPVLGRVGAHHPQTYKKKSQPKLFSFGSIPGSRVVLQSEI